MGILDQVTGRPPRILLVRLSAIGDCLHAAPVVSTIRRTHPDAFIGWAIQEPSATLLRGYPGVDRFHVYPRRIRGARARLLALWRFRRELQSFGYDTAVDVQGLTKSGLVAWCSGARERVGFGGGRALGSRELNAVFVNRRFRIEPTVRHVVDRNLALARACGLAADDGATPEWRLAEYDEPAALSFLEAGGLAEGSYAVVSPGTIWRTKRWPAERFAAVARRLAGELSLPVVVVWAGDEERLAAERVAEGAGEAGRVSLAPPTDLRELATLLRHAALFIGCDSGPAHLAAALGVPCVSVFGPTDPARNGPVGPRSASVQLQPLMDCQPCWRRTCSRGDFACLERLEADRVFAACAQMLGPPGRDPALGGAA